VVRAQSQALVSALRAVGSPLTVFTLSGPPATSPVGVASFDTKAIIKQILVDSRLPITAFEPVGYLGNLSAFFSAPWVVYRNELRYPLPADHRQPWISTADQAALAVAALDRPDLAGTWFPVGEQLTGPELAAGLSAGFGRTITYVPLDPDAFGASLAPVMGEELGRALAEDYRMLGRRPAELQLDRDTTVIRRELGVPATPVSTWATTQDWDAAASLLGRPQDDHDPAASGRAAGRVS
jgi:hypothetical protein